MVSDTGLILGGFLAGMGLVALVLRVTARSTLLAQPNERSLHGTPTPTMGGLGIAGVVLAYLGWAVTADETAMGWLAALAIMAALGLADDLRNLSRVMRLVVQGVCAAVVIALVTGVDDSWLLMGVLWLGTLWFVNLYNFMDGIDGLAGAQCVLFCLGVQVLTGGIPGWPGAVVWLAGAATAGFLYFNWAPARIFMGDVGSAFLGLLLAVVALHLWHGEQLALTTSLILLAAFWVDASYTLAIRVLTGQRFADAHRSHMYQHLATRFGHAAITGGFVVLYLVWLLPLAWVNERFLSDDAFLQIGCLFVSALPIGVSCVATRAGMARR